MERVRDEKRMKGREIRKEERGMEFRGEVASLT